MREIDREKIYALKRFAFFMNRLAEAQNTFDIEAQVYTIFRTAERIHGKMHLINSLPEKQVCRFCGKDLHKHERDAQNRKIVICPTEVRRDNPEKSRDN